MFRCVGKPDECLNLHQNRKPPILNVCVIKTEENNVIASMFLYVCMFVFLCLWVDEWMDGWMDVYVDEFLCVCMYVCMYGWMDVIRTGNDVFVVVYLYACADSMICPDSSAIVVLCYESRASHRGSLLTVRWLVRVCVW